MKRAKTIVAVSLVIGILGSAGTMRAGESYGQPLTEKETVSVSTILDKPYVYVGMTLLYAVSGILLNHLRDWNSNYRIERVETSVQLSSPGAELSPPEIDALLQELGEEEPYRGLFRPDPSSLQIFFEGRTLTVDLVTGAVSGEMVRRRKMLSALNARHRGVQAVL